MDTLKSFISLLALINPIGAIPFFISLTTQQTEEEKRHTIKIASISVATVVGISALLGQQIIEFFNISVASLQVGGGLIMIMMAMNMLNAQTGRTKATPEEEDEAEAKASIAVVPLALPLLTGPGSISTVIVYAGKTQHWYQLLILVGIGIALGAVVYIVFRAADPIARVIGRTGINIGTRLMGLILSALAVEFIVDGLKTLLPVLKS
ncbi:YchE family NAAT transporter [Cupriavidus basilensis]|uniref:YchE family NAAT transporter n=1 Tax=Cupriavidus TaxID=106589 RepID=UPI000453B108|nr:MULTISPECIES: YchE family NAAT transporter [Cupriavidus]KDP84935.1 membrane protein [Cupriavidus sp. SK-3]KJK22859.1 membrane protein [Burkholderiaceae bacterium 16]MDF3882079.1 YchE family NAAT transporter [Cupriavidus basilensis]